MTVKCMLASPHTTIAPTVDEAVEKLMADGGWSWEIKWDGGRALLHIQEGRPRLVSRSGRDVTALYPDVINGLPEKLADAILDGELVCLGSDGRPDIQRIAARENSRPGIPAGKLAECYPATYIPFDILATGGVDQRLQSYTRRRLVLEDTLYYLGLPFYPASPDGKALLEFSLTERLEGLVAKRAASPYVPRRSPDWIKLPIRQSTIVDVVGWHPGSGSRADTFGSLLGAVWTDDGEMTVVCKVAVGFDDQELVEYRAHLDTGRPLVILVEHLGRLPSGMLRNPVHKLRLQDDPSLARADQFDT